MNEENEVQDVLIRIMNERLDKFEEKLDAMATVDDCKDLRVKIDSHCVRIREIERQKSVLDAEFKPIKKLYENIATAMLGFFIVVGVVVVSVIYFLRDKIK